MMLWIRRRWSVERRGGEVDDRRFFLLLQVR